jgi:hypothetical protein
MNVNITAIGNVKAALMNNNRRGMGIRWNRNFMMNLGADQSATSYADLSKTKGRPIGWPCPGA